MQYEKHIGRRNLYLLITQIWGVVLLFLGVAQAQEKDHPTTHIGQRTMIFYDQERHRELITEIWYPTEDTLKSSDRIDSSFDRSLTVRDGKFPTDPIPLIMFSHGTGSDRVALEWLAQKLATNGYMVAAVDHWGNTRTNKIDIEFVKPWERPLDLSYVLSKLLADSVLMETINPNKIGALGFSFGGYTVIALAGAVLDYPTLLGYYETPEGKNELANIQEFPGIADILQDSSFILMTHEVPLLKDDRFNAFVAISPGTAQGFTTSNQFKQVIDPIFILGFQGDDVTPVERYARHYHQLIAHSEYVEFENDIGHYIMLGVANQTLREEAPEVFVDPPGVDRRKIHERVSRLVNEFYDQHLK